MAVIALLSKHLGVSLLTAHGAEKTRAMLERTILDASSGKPCRVKVPMWGWLRPSRPEGVRAEPAGMTTPATAVPTLYRGIEYPSRLFDASSYPCLDTTRGRPFGVYVHGNECTEGAERGVAAITAGLGWVKAAETVVVSGKPSKSDVEACWELGATVAGQVGGQSNGGSGVASLESHERTSSSHLCRWLPSLATTSSVVMYSTRSAALD